MVGEKIHQYEILKKLGAGGQGTVYKALDTKLDRTVVIKVLPPELTAKTANFTRFEREAKLLAQPSFELNDWGQSGQSPTLQFGRHGPSSSVFRAWFAELLRLVPVG